MKTYDFDQKNGDARIYFDSKNKREAMKRLKLLVKNVNDWRFVG